MIVADATASVLVQEGTAEFRSVFRAWAYSSRVEPGCEVSGSRSQYDSSHVAHCREQAKLVLHVSAWLAWPINLETAQILSVTSSNDGENSANSSVPRCFRRPATVVFAYRLRLL